MLETLLPILYAAVAGALLKPIMDVLLKAWTWLQMQNDWVIRVVLAAVAAGVTVAEKWLGVPLVVAGSDFFHIPAEVLNTALLALFGHLTHVFTKSDA